IFLSRQGTLDEQMKRVAASPKVFAPNLFPPWLRRLVSPATPAPKEKSTAKSPNLQFFNGLGGFSEDGRDYVTILWPRQNPPALWINVIANPHFGFQVSESGAGYTWSMNSGENQLTPWSNDAVSDPFGEIFYVRDQETGEVWTPTASPIREDTSP